METDYLVGIYRELNEISPCFSDNFSWDEFVVMIQGLSCLFDLDEETVGEWMLGVVTPVEVEVFSLTSEELSYEPAIAPVRQYEAGRPLSDYTGFKVFVRES